MLCFMYSSRFWLGQPSFELIPDGNAADVVVFPRLASNFALCSDLALTLGGRLKFAEMVSGRMADVLSNLYMGCVRRVSRGREFDCTLVKTHLAISSCRCDIPVFSAGQKWLLMCTLQLCEFVVLQDTLPVRLGDCPGFGHGQHSVRYAGNSKLE